MRMSSYASWLHKRSLPDFHVLSIGKHKFDVHPCSYSQVERWMAFCVPGVALAAVRWSCGQGGRHCLPWQRPLLQGAPSSHSHPPLSIISIISLGWEHGWLFHFSSAKHELYSHVNRHLLAGLQQIFLFSTRAHFLLWQTPVLCSRNIAFEGSDPLETPVKSASWNHTITNIWQDC